MGHLIAMIRHQLVSHRNECLQTQGEVVKETEVSVEMLEQPEKHFQLEREKREKTTGSHLSQMMPKEGEYIFCCC